ncbi:MAG: heavy-metal-associated domain-containing protein [Gammaproteobacteria bacterium]|nr:heavy-metal-associated domain-containing protein [Gammaproteobacteria bacterium]
MERFSIPKMSCGGCVKTITGAVRAVDQNAVVEPDLARREVSIRSSTGSDALLAALAQAGYPATKLVA